MIFGTHLALDNSDHVLDGGPNPPLRGILQNVPRHVSCIMGVLQNVPRHVPVGHLSTSWALVLCGWDQWYQGILNIFKNNSRTFWVFVKNQGFVKASLEFKTVAQEPCKNAFSWNKSRKRDMNMNALLFQYDIKTSSYRAMPQQSVWRGPPPLFYLEFGYVPLGPERRRLGSKKRKYPAIHSCN